MASNSQQPATGGSPPKPWEQAGDTSGSGSGSGSGAGPFKPPSAGSTSDVVESSGTARPGEIVSTTDQTAVMNMNTIGRPLPSRPWEQQQTYGGTYGGGYSSGLNNNSVYGTGMYGSSYGGVGSYGGGGLYGNGMYRGGYGGLYGNSGMYGGAGGMYGGGIGGGLGGPMGGYGMGGMGGPYGEQDPNNPFGPPSSPPGFWISLLRVMQGVVNFFGRVSILIDQNTQALHMFMSALLQLFDRSGVLYGELARFVLRLLGIETKPPKTNQQGPDRLPGPHNPHGNQNYIEASKAAPSAAAWDNVWGSS